MAVETARDGEEALAHFAHRQAAEARALRSYDARDERMGLLDEVARGPSLRQIPIGVRTATERGKVSGAVEVMSRPIDLTALLRIVERYVRGEQNAGA